MVMTGGKNGCNKLPEKIEKGFKRQVQRKKERKKFTRRFPIVPNKWYKSFAYKKKNEDIVIIVHSGK